MKRVVRGVTAALALVALSALPAAAASSLPRYRTVVVVLAPYLTWQDVDPDIAPTLASLAGDAALGCASVRAGSLEPMPDDIRGAAVLSAGEPVAGPPVDGGPAGEAHGRLGSAVVEAGGCTAAIGTAATSPSDALGVAHAPAMIVAADEAGAANVVETSARLLRSDPSAPHGLRTDFDVLESAYRRALSECQDVPGPLLIVLDPGDSARARSAAGESGSWPGARRDAVASIDAAVRVALRSLPEDGALVVVSTAQYEQGGRTAGSGPVIVYGAGTGVLHSTGTRRDGIVTLPDVTATVLSLLAVEAPSGVTGSPLRVVNAPGGGDALAFVARTDAISRALEAPRTWLWWTYIGVTVSVVLLAGAMVLLPRWRVSRRTKRALAGALVVLLAVPLGSLLAQLGPYPTTAAAAWTRLAVAVGVLWLACVGTGLRSGWLRVAGLLAGATALVVTADQLLGAHLAYGNAFSYSPLFGTRFYGLGNEGAALLVGALLVGVGARLERYRTSRPREFLLWSGVVIVIAVLPAFGANIGVVAWGTIGALVAYLYAARRRPTWRLAFGALVLMALLLAIALLVDAVLPGRSHLGGLFASAGAGGGLAILQRKLVLNLAILGATPLVLLLPFVIGGLAYLLARPVGPLGKTIVRHRPLGAALAGALAAAVVGTLTEDSGVAVSALVITFPVLCLVIAGLVDEEGP